MLAIDSPARADKPCAGEDDRVARPIAATLQPNASAFDQNGRFEVTKQSNADLTTDIYLRHTVGSKELFRAITRLQSEIHAVVVGRLPASEGLGFSIEVEEGGSGNRQFCMYGFRFQQDGVVSYRTLAARAVTSGGSSAGVVTDWKSASKPPALVIAQSGSSPISLVQASNVPCNVGRPNVKPHEGVTWFGQCADRLATGPGTAQWTEKGKPTLRFEGTFARGLLEGKGKMIGADGDRYEGDYKGGLRHGRGIYVSANGARFEGEYLNNQRLAGSPALPPANPPPAQNQALRTPPPAVQTPSPTSTVDPQPMTAVTTSPSEPTLKQVYEAAQAGRLEQAQAMMQQVLVAHPNSAKAHFVQAELSARQGQLGRARDSLATAEKLAPGLPFAKQEAVQALRSQLAAERGSVFDHFAKKHNLLNKETKGLYTNPFAFEGDKLFLVVGFEQMQSATTGLFYLPTEGILVVNDIPKGTFIKKGKILLAAKVLGNVKFDGDVGGLVQVHGMVPNLKFLGALICRDDRCDQTDEK